MGGAVKHARYNTFTQMKIVVVTGDRTCLLMVKILEWRKIGNGTKHAHSQVKMLEYGPGSLWCM